MTFRDEIKRFKKDGHSIPRKLRKLLEATIDTLPLIQDTHFDMVNWISETPCGTTVCIGGCMSMLHHKLTITDLEKENDGTICSVAGFMNSTQQDLLECTIFYVDNWYADHQKRYWQAAENGQDKVPVAVDALKRFLEVYDQVYQEKVGE